jgi:hypothetical protein
MNPIIALAFCATAFAEGSPWPVEPRLLADGETFSCSVTGTYPDADFVRGVFHVLKAVKVGTAFTKDEGAWPRYSLDKAGLRNGDASLEFCASTPDRKAPCEGDTLEFNIGRWTYLGDGTLAQLDFRLDYVERGPSYFVRHEMISIKEKPRNLIDDNLEIEFRINNARSKLKHVKVSCFVKKAGP